MHAESVCTQISPLTESFTANWTRKTGFFATFVPYMRLHTGFTFVNSAAIIRTWKFIYYKFDGRVRSIKFCIENKSKYINRSIKEKKKKIELCQIYIATTTIMKIFVGTQYLLLHVNLELFALPPPEL